MNNTQLKILLMLLLTVLSCGCDVVTGGRARAERVASLQKAAELHSEIEMLKDQNSQLTKMLEESESKLAEKTSELEQAQQQLQESLAANAALQTRLSETDARLVEVGALANQIQESFQANTASLEKQIQALGQMLPQAAGTGEQDSPAEQTAENSDDHSKQK
jgi:DNA repair exonuclease SbcCD ATPase subunit